MGAAVAIQDPPAFQGPKWTDGDESVVAKRLVPEIAEKTSYNNHKVW